MRLPARFGPPLAVAEEKLSSICRTRRELSDSDMKPEPRKRLQFCSRCGDFGWFSSPAAANRPPLRTVRAPVAFSATARTARVNHRFEARRRAAAAVATLSAATYDTAT